MFISVLLLSLPVMEKRFCAIILVKRFHLKINLSSFLLMLEFYSYRLLQRCSLVYLRLYCKFKGTVSRG
jgi:hypothetical protein